MLTALTALIFLHAPVSAETTLDLIQKTSSQCTVRAALGPSNTPIPLVLSNFLLDHPDFAAFIVNRHKIAPYRIDMQGPRRSSADDGDGTVGVVDLVERSDQHRVYFGQGVHHSAVFPDIHATAVIIMDLVEHVPSGEKTSTSTRFDVCVRMNNFLISGLVKSLRPFLKKTIIGKFSKAFFVADQVGRLIAKDPKSVSQDAADFPRLSSEDRSQFLSLISKLPQ